MAVFLRVREGNRFRDVATLSGADPLIIGRTEIADLSFPQDAEMSGRHAEVKLDGQVCKVRDLGSTNGTFLNEEPVKECNLRPGEVLRCGMTEFAVEVTGPDRPARSSQPEASGQPEAAIATSAGTHPSLRGNASALSPLPQELELMTGFCAEKSVDVARRFAIAEMVTIPPDPEETPDEFTTRLLKAGADNDCLYFLAYALPKRLGVWWLTQCIRATESLKSDGDPAMLDAAEAWVRAPSDSTRRKAMKLAEDLEMGTPASWAGVGAFWSHGSMAPVGAPEVPAPDRLAGKAIAGGAILATILREPQKASERRKLFVEMGLQVAAGELTWQPAE